MNYISGNDRKQVRIESIDTILHFLEGSVPFAQLATGFVIFHLKRRRIFYAYENTVSKVIKLV